MVQHVRIMIGHGLIRLFVGAVAGIVVRQAANVKSAILIFFYIAVV